MDIIYSLCYNNNLFQQFRLREFFLASPVAGGSEKQSELESVY